MRKLENICQSQFLPFSAEALPNATPFFEVSMRVDWIFFISFAIVSFKCMPGVGVGVEEGYTVA